MLIRDERTNRRFLAIAFRCRPHALGPGRSEPAACALAGQRCAVSMPHRVPGCGSGYEVARLAQAGFDVTGIDYAPAAAARTRAAIEVASTQRCCYRSRRARVVAARAVRRDLRADLLVRAAP
jgi:protein-L-isoaspartate O-methyltransferase